MDNYDLGIRRVVSVTKGPGQKLLFWHNCIDLIQGISRNNIVDVQYLPPVGRHATLSNPTFIYLSPQSFTICVTKIPNLTKVKPNVETANILGDTKVIFLQLSRIAAHLGTVES